MANRAPEATGSVEWGIATGRNMRQIKELRTNRGRSPCPAAGTGERANVGFFHPARWRINISGDDYPMSAGSACGGSDSAARECAWVSDEGSVPWRKIIVASPLATPAMRNTSELSIAE